MTKLFISQPMKGRTDEEIKRERIEAVEMASTLIKGEIEVIDSFFEKAPVDAKPMWFLGKSIELLSEADAVFFCKGWEDARGCKIEHEVAHQYNIPLIIVDHN